MSGGSLRVRLLLGAGLWVTLALLAAGIAIVLIFAASVARDVREDLQASLDQLIARIEPGQDLTEFAGVLADPRYATPAGGFYWQVEDGATGEIATSRSLWDGRLDAPAPDAPGEAVRHDAAGPGGQALAVLTTDIRLETAAGLRQLRVSVAEDMAVRGRDIRQFGLDIAVALLAVGAALIGAGWLQVHLGLKPLQRLRHAVEAVASGSAARLPDDFPDEVRPLVAEVNALLGAQEQAVGFARARADDLAHGLKTPLAVLGATAGRLRSAGDTENAGVLDLLTTEMTERIDYQLRLAQLRMRGGLGRLRAPLDETVLRSVAVLRKTGAGEQLHWKLDADRLDANIDPSDLMELVGVVLENAAKWAHSTVEVSCKRRGGMAELLVEDDGPGLTEEQISQLGDRGRRLDESRPGSGLGLAIAREILALNGGSMQIGRSAAGGVSMRIALPPHP